MTLDPTYIALFGRALVSAVAIGLVCSLLSVLIVLKRMAFLGQGISHAGFGGVGVAIFFGLVGGWGQDLIVLAFCLTTALLIAWLGQKKRLEIDSAIGILLAAAMALGVILTDLAGVLRANPWYASHLASATAPPGFEQLLFGSLMNVGPAQMWTAVILSAAVMLALASVAKEMLFFAFDETAARVAGVPTRWLYYLLLVLLSLTIVVSIRLVGFVLVSALLVIPGATATLLSQRLGRVLGLSVAAGLIGSVGGFFLSLAAGNLSSGACIVAVLCFLFILALIWRHGLNWRPRRA